jgi:exodeoxyribonuclease VII large subunit
VSLETSPESPAQVRTIARLVADWVARCGRIWVEGQISQLTRRPGVTTVFLTIRDTSTDISISVTTTTRVLEASGVPVTEGARVLLHLKPEVYLKRSSLQFTATEIRAVGVGELLLRLERLKQQLTAEGLFDPSRKRPPPFLPHQIGLVTGRASAALKDVVETGQRRWPGVEFRILEVAVQGPVAAAEVSAAVRTLDADPAVDVIVVARGGGSVEDLLPFSDEHLLRTVAECRTPLVSAIGHEVDSPLLDLVADIRAATPTDAARRIVPDLGEELAGLAQLRTRLSRAPGSRLDQEDQRLLRLRTALRDPMQIVDVRAADLGRELLGLERCLTRQLDRWSADLAQATATVRALSPQGVLDRGYAVVQTSSGDVVREVVSGGTQLLVRVAEGTFSAIAS